MPKSPVLLDRDVGACIYCGNDASNSTRDAHVYPVALFNNVMTLPRGVECDDCNEFSGTLERALLGHNRIGVPMVLRGIPGRSGKPRRQIGNIERDPKTGDVRLRAAAKVIQASNETIHVQLPDIAELDDGRFRRAMHHIGLNHLALIAGAETARQPRYDPVRRYVRYGQPPTPWKYAQFMYPDDLVRRELGCSHIRWEIGTIIRIRTLLDDFYVNLEGGDFLETWVRRSLPPATGLL